MSKLRPRITRTMRHCTVEYRGKRRPLIVTLDTQEGQISVRPRGCRKSKTYNVADLFVWGPQLLLL